MAQIATAHPVQCDQGGSPCHKLGGGLDFVRQNGNLYLGSDGKYYSGGRTNAGPSFMVPVIDARPGPAPGSGGTDKTAPWGSLPGDQYGSGGGLHDWYLIGLALLTLYVVMKLQPKWGVPLGYLVLLGAILSTEPAVNGFNSLVKSVQTGRVQ